MTTDGADADAAGGPGPRWRALPWALPPVGLYLLARTQDGWLAAVAWSGFFACVLWMIGLGLREALRPWPPAPEPETAPPPARTAGELAAGRPTSQVPPPPHSARPE